MLTTTVNTLIVVLGVAATGDIDGRLRSGLLLLGRAAALRRRSTASATVCEGSANVHLIADLDRLTSDASGHGSGDESNVDRTVHENGKGNDVISSRQRLSAFEESLGFIVRDAIKAGNIGFQGK